MQKLRSERGKNVLGSVLGGMLGILAFGYIHEVVLPVGCLLGVLFGWYYEMIFSAAIDGWRTGWQRSRDLCSDLGMRSVRAKNTVVHIDYFLPVRRMVDICTTVINTTAAVPRKITVWIKRRPMCAINFQRILSAIAGFFITSVWFMPLGSKLNDRIGNAVPGSDLHMLYSMCIIILISLLLVSLFASFLAEMDGERADFYRLWDRYERHGLLRSFLWGVVQILVFQVGISIMLICTATWFVCVGGLFFIFALAPIMCGVGMLKGIYNVSRRTDHWLCLISTLFVTIVAAYLMHPYFTDVRVLWITAMLTGGVAALVTEVVQKVIVRYCGQIDLLRNVIGRTIGEHTKPSRQLFNNITTVVIDWYSTPFAYILRR